MEIFHWVTPVEALKALATNTLGQRRWQHFLEAEQRFAKGTSWGMDAQRWQNDDAQTICLVADSDAIQNQKHLIAANRTYLLTQGKLKANFDPNAWQYESKDIDEVFIEGSIQNLKSTMLHVLFKPDFSPSTIATIEVAGVICKPIQTSHEELQAVDPTPQDDAIHSRLQALPRLQRHAGAAYTLYQLAAKALQGASGDAHAVNWAQVHQEVFAKAVGHDQQPADKVMEAIKKHSPGAVTTEQIAAVETLGESRKMQLLQGEVNTLASIHGLISNTVEIDGDGAQRVVLKRDEADGRYCQATLRVSSEGNIYWHALLYCKDSTIDNGERLAVSLEHAIQNAAKDFDHLVACDAMSTQMQSAFDYKQVTSSVEKQRDQGDSGPSGP